MSAQAAQKKQNISTFQDNIVSTFTNLKENIAKKSDKIPSLLITFCEMVTLASQHKVPVNSTHDLQKMNIPQQDLGDTLNAALSNAYELQTKQAHPLQEKMLAAENYLGRYRKNRNGRNKNKTRTVLLPNFNLERFAQLYLGLIP